MSNQIPPFIHNPPQQQYGAPPPTAQDIATAMVEAQAAEREKQGTKNSNVLALVAVFIIAPLGFFTLQSGGSIICGLAFLLVIVAAIMGSMAKR